MVVRTTVEFALRRSWLLLPAAAAGAGAGYAVDGLSAAVAAGAAIGLAPALAGALALELRGHSLRDEEDVSRCTGLDTLGAIGRFDQAPGSALPAEANPEALEAYRELARCVENRGPDVRTVLVTSAGPEEGKSTTAANLATLLAQMGKRVVLVDGDLRWSSLRSTVANVSSPGLAGLLLNHLHTPQLAVVRTNERNLCLLPAGDLPRGPQALLSLPRLGDIVASLNEIADYLVFDSPPVLEAEDARLLARHADVTLLVMRAGKTRSREVQRALKLLARAGVVPAGAVLNQARAPRTVPAPAAVPEAAGEAAPAFGVEEATAAPASPAYALQSSSEERSFSDVKAPLETPPYAGRLAALRNLRLVQPDERPSAPPVTAWGTLPTAEASSDAWSASRCLDERPAVLPVTDWGSVPTVEASSEARMANRALDQRPNVPPATGDVAAFASRAPGPRAHRQAEEAGPIPAHLRAARPTAFAAPVVHEADVAAMPTLEPATVLPTPEKAGEVSGGARYAAPAAELDASVEGVLAHMEETLRLIRSMREEASSLRSC